ncbi:MAG: hypothetical protein AB7K52_00150 [Phycisphaerales bacterium]
MTLAARYAALPRSAKWLIVAGAFVAAYFLAIEPALVHTARLNSEADKLASSLQRKSQMRTRVSEAAAQIEKLAGLLGQPALPGDPGERDNALRKRINAIFSEHKVQGQKVVYKDPTPISVPEDSVVSLVGPGKRLERLAVDLTFETDIPTLMAIMQSLERAPEVCAVSRVNVRKLAPPGSSRSRERDGGPVQVNLTAETWATGNVAPTTRGARPSTTGGER